MDSVTKKTYLIRSNEAQQILATIKLLAHEKSAKQKQFLRENALQYLYSGANTNWRAEYCGLVEIATCKSADISNKHSTLAQYTFAHQYLHIANTLFEVYDLLEKDRISLQECEFSLLNTATLSAPDKQTLVPVRFPFVFQLLRKDFLSELFHYENLQHRTLDNQQGNNNTRAQQIANTPLSQLSGSHEDSIIVFNALKSSSHQQCTESPSQLGIANIQPREHFQQPAAATDSVPTQVKTVTAIKKQQQQQQWQQQLVAAQPEENKNFFQRLFDKITQKKQDQTLILAAECDEKRRAWGFSINYYKSVLLSQQLQKHKNSFRQMDGAQPSIKNIIINTEETKNSFLAQQQLQQQQQQQLQQVEGGNAKGVKSSAVVQLTSSDRQFIELDDHNDYIDLMENTRNNNNNNNNNTANNNGRNSVVEELRDEENSHYEDEFQEMAAQRIYQNISQQVNNNPANVLKNQSSPRNNNATTQKRHYRTNSSKFGCNSDIESVQMQNIQGTNDRQDSQEGVLLTLPNQFTENVIKKHSYQNDGMMQNVLPQTLEIRSDDNYEQGRLKRFLLHFLSTLHNGEYVRAQPKTVQTRNQSPRKQLFTVASTVQKQSFYQETEEAEQEPSTHPLQQREIFVKKNKLIF